jgi:hypothetical protein
MTLRQFLDAGYALLVEEYQRLGMGLTEALQELESLRAHVRRPEGEAAPVPEAEVVRQNEASLKQLQMMMGGAG